MGILTILILAPLVAAILLALVPKLSNNVARALGIGASLGILSLTFLMKGRLDGGSGAIQLMESYSWVPRLGLGYRVGVDGNAAWLIMLVGLVGFVATCLSGYIHDRVKTFVALVLLLECAMIGAFASLDLVLFFSFFELTLLPMYVLISVWGGEHRARAASKFLIYTFGGSIFMLVGMIALALRHQQLVGSLTFDVIQLQALASNGQLWLNAVPLQNAIFWSFAIAFLVKAPVFPLHTWIADTYGEAPAAVQALSAAMVKLGSFGILRFCLPLFPDAARTAAPILAILATIGIVYGAILAAVQTDLRRMAAYSTLSHMGFVMLGIFTLQGTGVLGGGYGQLAHGITACAMAFLIGAILHRFGSTRFEDLGGIKTRVPVLAFFFIIVAMSTLGLPSTIGFVGEFLTLLGTFQAGFFGGSGISLAVAVIAGFGVVVAAAYTLNGFGRAFTGARPEGQARPSDLRPWEIGVAAGLGLLILVGGLAPTFATKSMEPSLEAARKMTSAAPAERPTFLDDDPTDDLVTMREDLR